MPVTHRGVWGSSCPGCVVSWLWQVPAAQVSAGQDDWACFRARSFFWTHMLCFVLTGAASTARQSKRQMRRSTWTKVKGPGVRGFCLGCKTWLMFWCSGNKRLHSSWGEYVSGFPSCKHSTLKFIYFGNRENKSIWVKWFEGTDRRKVYQIFALFLATERHLFLATWNLGRIFPRNTLLKQFLNGPEAILQERECELCCLFFSALNPIAPSLYQTQDLSSELLAPIGKRDVFYSHRSMGGHWHASDGSDLWSSLIGKSLIPYINIGKY